MSRMIMIGLATLFLCGCANSSSDGFEEVKSKQHSNPKPVSTAGIGAPMDMTSALQGNRSKRSNAEKRDSDAYEIGPQDVIEISVFKVPELSKVVQVSEAGTINLPLIGEVEVSGKTARKLERRLTRRLGKKYLQNPQVSVFIKEYNSQRITVEGAVEKPGVFPMQGGLSLLQAIAMAQGLKNVSDNTVLIFRDKNNTRKAARFDVSAIRNGDASDPELRDGDVIVAGSSAIKESFNGLLKALPITGIFSLL